MKKLRIESIGRTATNIYYKSKYKKLSIIVVLVSLSCIYMSNTACVEFFCTAIRGKVTTTVEESYRKYLETVELDLPTKEISGVNVVLLLTLAEVESQFNLRAVGDNNKAHGMFQMHQEAIDQVYKVKQYPWAKELNVEGLKMYPLRQLQLAIEYLKYWYSIGGTTTMLKYWNNTNSWYTKVQTTYKKWYDEWEKEGL